MRFQIITRVSGDHRTVFSKFDKELLLKLVPPGMKLELLRYDEPTSVGGIVHIKMKMLGLIRQEWYNEITELEENDDQCYFTDEGVRLPRMLKEWRHRHIVRKGANGTEIVDDVSYKGRNKLMTWLLYMPVRLQFMLRKPGYRKAFGKP